jgi:hypothetical protein
MPKTSIKEKTKSSKSTKKASEPKLGKPDQRTTARQLGLKGGEQPQVMLGGVSSLPLPGPEVPCRVKSTLAIYPNIISNAFYEVDPTDGNIWIQFTLNPKHQIFTTAPRSCPNSFEGLVFLTESSSNVCAISNFFYFGNPITSIQLKVAPCSFTQPLTLGFRIKFEENFNATHKENPKKKDGTAMVGGGQVVLK